MPAGLFTVADGVDAGPALIVQGQARPEPAKRIAADAENRNSVSRASSPDRRLPPQARASGAPGALIPSLQAR